MAAPIKPDAFHPHLPVEPEKLPASQEVKKAALEALLKLAPPVRDIILKDLSSNDLDAFEIALSKGTTLPSTVPFQAVKKQITQIKQNRILQEILQDHPEWKSQVKSWNNVSLEDKIWLLQLYELRNLGVGIPQVYDHDPSEWTPDLLRPVTKKKIIEALSIRERLDLKGKNLQKCPRVIRLLVNLRNLDLSDNQLTVPPDVSQNVHLEILKLNNNQLTVPPDVSRNINLEVIELVNNPLTVSPDFTRNVNLKQIFLQNNQLTSPPDVSRNVKLELLYITNNQLTVPPDVTQNVNLVYLQLSKNQLTVTPNVTRNVKLQRLELFSNQLTVPPDVSKNLELRRLDLYKNQCTDLPVINQNLKYLDLRDNPLTTQSKEALAKLKSEREKLEIDY